MSSAVAGYTGALGSDGPPPSYADIDEAEVLLLVGSNAKACHPIVWNRIRSKGAFLIVADPRRTPTAEHADLHLPVRPGTDLPLLNAMLHVLERDGLLDRTFLERHTRGAEDALTIAAEWTPERAADVCGVPARGHRRRRAPLRLHQARDGAVVDGRQPVDASARSRTARSSTSAWPPATSAGPAPARCR